MTWHMCGSSGITWIAFALHLPRTTQLVCMHPSVSPPATTCVCVCERERESVCVCVTWHGTTESNLHSTEVADVIALLLPPRLGLSTSIYLYKHTNTHTIHTHTNTHTHTPQVEEAFYLHLKTPPLKCPHKWVRKSVILQCVCAHGLVSTVPSDTWFSLDACLVYIVVSAFSLHDCP
jgi:hypothetical protein